MLDGRRRFPDLIAHWAKKLSKSFSSSFQIFKEQVVSPERRERLIGIASFDEDQSGIIGGQVKTLVERSGLADRFTIYRNEIAYHERVRDARTGGHYTPDHRVLILPRDLKGTHGLEWHMVVKDEEWTAPDHSFDEALLISPTRPYGYTVHLFYYPPATMMRPGVPVFDLLQRVKSGDPSIFYSYIGGLAEDAPWRQCSWITEAWVWEQEKLFAASPSRFKRVVLNVPAPADGDGLVTTQELRDALDPALREPAHGTPGTISGAGLDLGFANDHSVLTVVRLDARARAEVVLTRARRGTRDNPVAFIDVENTILDVHRRFPLRRLDCDAWNAKLLVERLAARGVPARMVTVEATKIDKLITTLKAAFANRQVRIGSDQSALIEQAEAVRVVESRQRDRLKLVNSGSGPDASQHDDFIVSLALSLGALETCGVRVGEQRVPMHGCAHGLDCALFDGPSLPPGFNNPVCEACPGWRIIGPAWREAAASGGDLRRFVKRFTRPAAIDRQFESWTRNIL